MFMVSDVHSAAKVLDWYLHCTKEEYLEVLDAATEGRRFHKYEEAFRCLRKPGWRAAKGKLSFEKTVELLEQQL